jgi:hypothetical protein
LPDPHDIVAKVFLQLFGCIMLFQCGAEMARVGGRIMGIPSLDENKVWYTERKRRQRHDGVEERDGHFIPIYSEYDEQTEHRRSSSDQLTDAERDLMRQGVGHCWINENGKVWQKQFPMLDDPYPWAGLAHNKCEVMLETMIWSAPEYQSPTIESPNGFIGHNTDAAAQGNGTHEKPRWSNGMKRTPAHSRTSRTSSKGSRPRNRATQK